MALGLASCPVAGRWRVSDSLGLPPGWCSAQEVGDGSWGSVVFHRVGVPSWGVGLWAGSQARGLPTWARLRSWEDPSSEGWGQALEIAPICRPGRWVGAGARGSGSGSCLGINSGPTCVSTPSATYFISTPDAPWRVCRTVGRTHSADGETEVQRGQGPWPRWQNEWGGAEGCVSRSLRPRSRWALGRRLRRPLNCDPQEASRLGAPGSERILLDILEHDWREAQDSRQELCQKLHAVQGELQWAEELRDKVVSPSRPTPPHPPALCPRSFSLTAHPAPGEGRVVGITTVRQPTFSERLLRARHRAKKRAFIYSRILRYSSQQNKGFCRG